MVESNRRDFLKRASWGAVGVGAVVAAPELLFAGEAAAAPAVPVEVAPPAPGVVGPIVVLLRDAGTGEFTVMHGEKSSTFTDRGLAARLAREVPSA